MEKIRIGIDISRTVEESTGVGYYAKNLVHALAKIDSDNEYLLYGIFFDCFPKKWKEAPVPISPNFRLHLKSFPSPYVIRRWKRARRSPGKIIGGIDILHSTAFTMPPVSSPKVIVTIHDLSCYVYPQFHTEANRQFVNRNVHQAARRAHFIIADSESTRREIKKFLHVRDEKMEVIHLAAHENFQVRCDPTSVEKIRHKYALRKPYFLSVGSIEPRKNLGRLWLLSRH